MGIRRVVTGHDDDGRAVFAADEVVEPLTLALAPGAEFHRLWGADEAPSFPDDGAQPAAPQHFPGVGGYRFNVLTLPPDATALPEDLDMAAGVTEMEQKLPGMAAHMEPDNPGMHTTATVDCLYVISGRVVLELDGSVTRELGPGDTLVQNGTRHAWRNPYDKPCVLVVVLIGANHDRGV